ncbi:MAG: hypothetical protein Kow0074_05940 [Candidatus Zixiibacteriota bacterium]
MSYIRLARRASGEETYGHPDQRVSRGETAMAEKGKKDKGQRETKKKPALDPKEKRRLKREKKNK